MKSSGWPGQTTFPPSSQHEVLVRQMRKRMHRRGILQRRGLSPLAVTHLYHQPTHTKYTTRETVPFNLFIIFFLFHFIENKGTFCLWNKLSANWIIYLVLIVLNTFWGIFNFKKWKFTFLEKMTNDKSSADVINARPSSSICLILLRFSPFAASKKKRVTRVE